MRKIPNIKIAKLKPQQTENNPKKWLWTVVLTLRLWKTRPYGMQMRNKPNPAPQAGLIEEALVAIISKVNLVNGSEGWWIDTSGSCHVCYDRDMFKTYNVVGRLKPLLLLEQEI